MMGKSERLFQHITALTLKPAQMALDFPKRQDGVGLQVWQLKMSEQARREPPPHCDPIDLAGAVPESWYRQSSEVVAFEPGVGDHPCSRQGGTPVSGAPDLPALTGVRKISPTP